MKDGEGQRAQEATWILRQVPGASLSRRHHPDHPTSHLPVSSRNSLALPPPDPSHPPLPTCHHPSHLPSVPTSVPMASTTKSADLPTWPVSKPGPQARTFCTPASGLTCTSKGLGKEGAGVHAGSCPHQRYSSPSLPSESQAARLPLPPSEGPDLEARGPHGAYLRGMA